MIYRRMHRLTIFLLLLFRATDGKRRVTRSTKLNKSAIDGNLHREFPTIRLSNGRSLPAVGMGVGSLPRELVVPVITDALKRAEGYQLLDTAKVSHNEHLISDAMAQHVADLETTTTTLHVVTKVWYTHLGYERTLLSVQETLNSLRSAGNYNIRVHILLHWPRCNDSIQWMDCEREEHQLPQYVKDTGPPPHLDKANAWKDSWRALENIFDNHTLPIESIGISNFEVDDLKELLSFSRHTPQVYQGNIWTLLKNEELMHLLDENKITFQAYNVMNGIIRRGDTAPAAYNELTNLGDNNLQKGKVFSPSQLVLAWLVQNNVAVIPRSSSPEHQIANSPKSIAQVPALSNEQNAQIGTCVRALLEGQDVNKSHLVEVNFFNKYQHPIDVFWESHLGHETMLHKQLQPGHMLREETYPGHKFVVYDESKKFRKELLINVMVGEKQNFHIEL